LLNKVLQSKEQEFYHEIPKGFLFRSILLQVSFHSFIQDQQVKSKVFLYILILLKFPEKYS